MKISKLILLLLIVFSLCSCSGISLENAETLPFTHKYAEVDSGENQKKINKTYEVTEACDFTNKYISLLFNRSYENTTGKEEAILYSSSYSKDDTYYNAVKDYYTRSKAVTEASKITVNHVIMIDGDAYVNVSADIILRSCESALAAKSIGFDNGVGSTVTAELNLKLKYKNGGYGIYDVKWVEEEGKLLAFDKYDGLSVYSQDDAEIINALDKACDVKNAGTIRENTEEDLTNEMRLSEIKYFINNLGAAQNNRNYKTFSGNEDYPLLSEEYIAELNKDRDDVSYTKQIYQNLQLSTEYVSADVKSIEVRKDGYVVTADITSKITNCISNDRAVSIGYTGGIGSEGVMSFIYTVKNIDGSLKLADSIQTR